MLKIRGIDHLNLNVKNLDETVSFYHTLFGLEVKESGKSSRGNPYAIIGKKDAFYLCLYENPEFGTGDDTVFNHLGINVEDFAPVLPLLKERNIEVHYGGVVDYGKSRSYYITDPNGIEIEISEKFGGALD